MGIPYKVKRFWVQSSDTSPDIPGVGRLAGGPLVLSSPPWAPGLEMSCTASAGTGRHFASHCPWCLWHLTQNHIIIITAEITQHKCFWVFFFFTKLSVLPTGSGRRSTWESACLYTPCHQDAGNLGGKSLSHFSAAHISNAVQGEVHEGWIAAREVVLNAIIDQSNQITVWVHQHRDKQVALNGNTTKHRENEVETPYPTNIFESTTNKLWWQTYNLFLCILVGTEEVDSLHVSKVDIMSQKKDKEKLAHILLFTVTIQSLVTCPRKKKKKTRVSRLLLHLLSVRAHFK